MEEDGNWLKCDSCGFKTASAPLAAYHVEMNQTHIVSGQRNNTTTTIELKDEEDG